MVKSIITKYREQILYLIFGALTTAVNILCYIACRRLFGLSIVISTSTAWFSAVVFAYYANRIWVFGSKSAGRAQITEVLAFFSCRVLSYAVDVGIMYLFAEIMGLNDELIKLTSNVVVVVINYVLSKIYVFK